MNGRRIMMERLCQAIDATRGRLNPRKIPRALFVFLMVLCTLALMVPVWASEPQAVRFIYPEKELWIIEGDYLKIVVSGPAGAQASFSLLPIAESVPLHEEKPGSYTGIIRVAGTANKTIDGDLIVLFKNRTESVIPFAGKIKILGSQIPVVGLCGEKNAVLRTGPGGDFDRVATLPESSKVEICGRYGEWLKISLHNESCWVDMNSIKILPEGAQPSEPLLKHITARKEGQDSVIDFAFSGPCAFDLSDSVSPASLNLTFHNATSSLFEILYESRDSRGTIDFVRNTPGLLAFRINPGGLSMWGYEGSFKDNSFILRIKSAPSLADRESLKGLTVILDPGHGGRNSGAVGAGGLEEKDANLGISLDLKKLLEESGAHVVMTREVDRDLTPETSPVSEELQARVDRARENNGTIFISIHNNALADVNEGRRARGTFTYFYRLQSLELAKAINESLSGALNEQKNAFILRSFHVIRQSAMPAVLVEVTFISNPQEEEKLRSGDYRMKAAKGIHRGIMEFMKGTIKGTDSYINK
jgi:N-acetylmuramoyl-L-alanine amidase